MSDDLHATLLRAQRRVRDVAGRPYRAALTLGCRNFFERGQIDTAPRVALHQLGLGAPGREEYDATPWAFRRRMFRGLPVGRDDVFVDFGSGKGRVVLLAATHFPFRRVIGVEIAEELNAIARENVARMQHRLQARSVEVVTTDAAEFRVPDDMTYAYFFNPFQGEVFQRVIDNIVASVDRVPRPLTLIYANPVMSAYVESTGRFEVSRRTRGVRRDMRWREIVVYRAIPASVSS